MQVPLPRASNVACTGEITVEMISRTFRQWQVFEQGGTWWATRAGLQVWDGPRSLLLRVITAPDLTALADWLCAQEWLDGLDDETLEAVYRGDAIDSAP